MRNALRVLLPVVYELWKATPKPWLWLAAFLMAAGGAMILFTDGSVLTTGLGLLFGLAGISLAWNAGLTAGDIVRARAKADE